MRKGNAQGNEETALEELPNRRPAASSLAHEMPYALCCKGRFLPRMIDSIHCNQNQSQQFMI